MASILKYIYKNFLEIEYFFVRNLLRQFPAGHLAPVSVILPTNQKWDNEFSLEKIMQDSILWAVPKKRRSIEKRLQRKFGVPKYHWKPLVAKTNLGICSQCGSFYETDRLCPTCYNKVIAETKKMQTKIQEELKYSPIEEEVVVLYEGEENSDPEYWRGKRVVEMKKPRPIFFSKNLLQSSTETNAETSEVATIPFKLEYK